MSFVRLAMLCWLAMVAPGRAEAPCDPCRIDGGSYRVAPPPGWDGHKPLRLLLFLHGYRGTGTDIVTDPNIAGVANRLGFLLAAPDGLNKTWANVGAPARVRDDVAFLRAVVADVERRWPIDRRVVVAGGFSQGGSMVWDLACYAAPDFTAYIPFAGGFWEPLPDSCGAGPINLRHTHGMRDTVVPMHGRAIMGGKFRQGDILLGFARWRAADQCHAMPDRSWRDGVLTCSEWNTCASGHTLALCMQPDNHSMIAPWLRASLDWAVRVSGEAP